MTPPSLVRFVRLAALFAALAGLPAPVRADEATYSDRFVGISWEFTGSAPGSGGLPLEARELALVAAAGDRDVFPYPAVRLRGGLGWWPGNPFVAILGVEVAALELLNRTQSRMLGLYLRADARAGFGPGGFVAAARPSACALLPLNAVGGLALGAAWDTRLGFCLSLGYLTGTYLVNKAYASTDDSTISTE